MNDNAYYYLIHYNNAWSKADHYDYDDYDYDYKFEQGENSWVRYSTKNIRHLSFNSFKKYVRAIINIV